jgi:hypothetical protein
MWKNFIFHLAGTATVQNGAFVTDPDFPLTKYVNALYYPCVASIDENTGFLTGIRYYGGAWYGLRDTWKYNFTEGKNNFYFLFQIYEKHWILYLFWTVVWYNLQVVLFKISSNLEYGKKAVK